VRVGGWVAAGAVVLGCTACSEDPSRSGDTTVPQTVQQPGGTLPDPAVPDAEGTAADPLVDGGTCSVAVTGDVEAGWNGREDVSGATYGPWIAASTQEGMGESPAPVDRTYFNATCAGVGGQQLTFTANGAIPARPAVYRFRRDGDGQSADDLMQVYLQPTIDGDLWTVGEAGTLTITDFDDEHVAGSFEIVAAPIGPSPLERATATGEFDFVNTTG
jgi:hypothetical protein